jgi:hypothetical protein
LRAAASGDQAAAVEPRQQASAAGGEGGDRGTAADRLDADRRPCR